MRKFRPNLFADDNRKKSAFVWKLWEREVTQTSLTDEEKDILNLYKQKYAGEIDEEHRQKSSQNVCAFIEKNYVPSRHKKIFSFSRRVAAAAAILVLGLFTSLMFWFNKQGANTEQHQSGWITITTNSKELRTITLPDGSVVSLNNASVFSYRKSDFGNTVREVWLKEGEAFFEVAKNPEKPFIVNYDGMQSVVLGTSFNIKAYKALGENSLTVRTGKVKIIKGNQQLAVLAADDRLTYKAKLNTVKVSTADAVIASAWMSGKITFSDAPFSEIAMRLKDNFNTEAELKGVPEDEVRLTATFEENDSLEKIAVAIAGVNELKYKIETNRIVFYK